MREVSVELRRKALQEIQRFQERAFGAASSAVVIEAMFNQSLGNVYTALSLEERPLVLPDLPETEELTEESRLKLEALLRELHSMFNQMQAVRVIVYAVAELQRLGLSVATAQEIVAALRTPSV